MAKDLAMEFEELGRKYGLTAEQVKASLETRKDELTRAEHEVKLAFEPDGFTASANWKDLDVKANTKGNYVLASTPGMFLRTAAHGPHGGPISLKVIVVEVMPKAK